jgi:tetratricopeptide (TPR) repeat protein
MSRGLLLALLFVHVVAVLPAEGIAWADDPLAQARKAVAESDYVAARPALAAALDAGDHSPEEVAEIYRLSGIVQAALGDAKAATEAFTRLLALSPKAALPAGTSPKLKRPFDAAGRYFKTHAPLEVKVETVATPPTITLVVVSDPLDMIAKAHVVFAIDGGAERTKDAVASERTDVTLPAGRRIDARVAALDAHGNRLAEVGSKDVPIVIISDAPPVVAPAPVPRPTRVVVHAAPRPYYLQWWAHAAVGGVFGVAAVYFAWSTLSDANELERLNADSALHQFAEAQAVEDRGHRHALFTNIGLGAAGAFGIAAGILYLTRPRDHMETRITAAPAPGGGAIVLGGTF